jgi:hypothetical protein
MTMTELIGNLEGTGWRFQARDGQVAVRVPLPRPAQADAVLLELSRRRLEAVGFLKARSEAERLRELLGLPEIPVFQQTPPPEAKVLTFPAPIGKTQPAPVRRRS